MTTPDKNFAVALDAREKGLVAIPMHLGTKVPMVKWKEWQTAMPPVELLREWFRESCNIAIVTTGMVLFDAEDDERADLVVAHCGDTPHRVRSGGGGQHLGFRLRLGCVLTNQVKIKGLPLDIKTTGGLEMLPPSVTEKGAYEWLGPGLRPISELPVANIGWIRTRKRKNRSSIVAEGCEGNDVRIRGRAYIDKFHQRAVSGHGGHTTAFTAFLKIVSFTRKLGSGEAEAWQLCLYFNETKCDPPWDLSIPAEERALRHKFADALRLAK